jgi:hypothetical protein
MERKIFTVTFIPLFIWLMGLGFFYCYSEVFGRIAFPMWAFAFMSLPLCVGLMAICYVVMISRAVDRQSVWTWDHKDNEQKTE